MAELPELQGTLQTAVLGAFQGEYRELADTWRNIEQKAQGSVAIAGIFLAASLAFIDKLKVAGPILGKVMATGSVVTLIASITAAVVALKVRKIESPLTGGHVERLARPLLDLQNPTSLQERLPGFVGDMAFAWSEAIRHMKKHTEEKAGALWWSHVFLAGAIAFDAVAILNKIWSSAP